AAKFAADGEDNGGDAGVFADAAGRKCLRGERFAAAGRLEQLITENGVRQLVEIAEEALNAGIDELFGGAIGRGRFGIDEAGDFVESAAIFCPQENGAERFALAAEREERVEETQEDKFFTGDGDVGAPGIFLVCAED